MATKQNKKHKKIVLKQQKTPQKNVFFKSIFVYRPAFGLLILLVVTTSNQSIFSINTRTRHAEMGMNDYFSKVIKRISCCLGECE